MKKSCQAGTRSVIPCFTLSFDVGLMFWSLLLCLLTHYKDCGGMCDNLLTCIIRAWDYSRPLAPAMNTLMWNGPFTERHLLSFDELGAMFIPPIKKRLACRDYGNDAMAEPYLIYSSVSLFWESQAHQESGGTC
ncbi:unnamed protein product [Eruca vesicaria subsp. sativa]|uniref:Uncharacterized protein n=1 Tax=Eruca vesicaria subsp. sativa TaxID=29727 RepID=A0ABC8L714_ERUVS|nr:unnamed protein product [Eruca vesicaria subsp. sativa]